MIGLYIHLPFAHWKKPLASQYLETYVYPPISTCYGFLLAMVGETDVTKHLGAQVTFSILRQGHKSETTLLTKRNRYKNKKKDSILDHIEILLDYHFIVWVDQGKEVSYHTSLEHRVLNAMLNPRDVHIRNALYFGTSDNMMNEINLLDVSKPDSIPPSDIFYMNENGNICIPLWSDYHHCEKTIYVCGHLLRGTMPQNDTMPYIYNDKSFYNKFLI